MQKKAKKVLVLIVGIIFIALGLVGFVLPFLQGFIFLTIGLILVSFCSMKIRLWIKKHTEHHPRLASLVNKIEAWITKFLGEI